MMREEVSYSYITEAPTRQGGREEWGGLGGPLESSSIDCNNDTFAIMKFDAVITARISVSSWIVDIVYRGVFARV